MLVIWQGVPSGWITFLARDLGARCQRRMLSRRALSSLGRCLSWEWSHELVSVFFSVLRLRLTTSSRSRAAASGWEKMSRTKLQVVMADVNVEAKFVAMTRELRIFGVRSGDEDGKAFVEFETSQEL